MTSNPTQWRNCKKLKLAAGALVLGIGVVHAGAGATELTATGSGWCSPQTYGPCNNTDIHVNANTFTGYHAKSFTRSWFAFDLSTLAGQTITSATLSIWNSAQNLPGANDDLFSLYQAANISFDGLMNGPALGSVDAATADTGTGHYVSIALDPAGLAALNGASSFIFGGDTPSRSSEFFGYTDGTPPVRLDVETGPGANVPEPAPAALLGLGLTAMGILLRRKGNTRNKD